MRTPARVYLAGRELTVIRVGVNIYMHTSKQTIIITLDWSDRRIPVQSCRNDGEKIPTFVFGSEICVRNLEAITLAGGELLLVQFTANKAKVYTSFHLCQYGLF